MAVDSLSTPSRDSATPEIVVNRRQSIGEIARRLVNRAREKREAQE